MGYKNKMNIKHLEQELTHGNISIYYSWESKIVKLCCLFFKDFIYLFLDKGDGGRKGEKHQCVVAYCMPHTGDLAHNPGLCPDWELNQGPFGFQACTQSTEPHQPGEIMLSYQSFI